MTTDLLRAELAELRADMHRQTTRLLMWLVPTVFAGLAAAGGVGAVIR